MGNQNKGTSGNNERWTQQQQISSALIM